MPDSVDKVDGLDSVVAELEDPDGDLARQAFAIYEEAFPVDEREPLPHIVAGIHARRENPSVATSHFWVALDRTGVWGIALFGYHAPARLGFLSYLAVHSHARGHGRGAWLYHQVLAGVVADARTAGHAPTLGTCFEVERPAEAVTPGDRAMRQRRIGFYRRQGARLLEGLDFTAPPLAPGLAPVPYHLMFHPADPGPALPENALAQAVTETVLAYGYGLAPGDPYYRLPADG